VSQKCMKCSRTYPAGISSADGICFPCRWPARWTKNDEEAYKSALERAKPKKTAKAEEQESAPAAS
jgi:hypothetical protein